LITATAAVAGFSSFVFGFLTNMPVALGPGMGLNAYFAYQIVGYHGSGIISYNLALTAVFIEGFVFIFLSLIGMRQCKQCRDSALMNHMLTSTGCRARQNYSRITEDCLSVRYWPIPRIDRTQRPNWDWCSQWSQINPVADCWMPGRVSQGWNVHQPQDDLTNRESKMVLWRRRHVLI
jgi:hypothetical protein